MTAYKHYALLPVMLLATCINVTEASAAAEASQGFDERTLEYYRAFPLAYRGYRMRESGNDTEAVEQMTRALAILPQNLQYRLDLAQWLQQDGRYEEALQIVEAGMKYHPTQVLLLDLRAQLRNRLASEEQVAEKKVVEVKAQQKASLVTPKPEPKAVIQPQQPTESSVKAKPKAVAQASLPKVQKPVPRVNPCEDNIPAKQLTAAQNMQAAYCALQKQRPQHAITHFEHVRRSADMASRLQASKELGYLYSQQGDEKRASAMWDYVLQQESTAAVRLNQVRSLRVQERYREAEDVLAPLDAAELPKSLRSRYFEERSYLADATKQTMLAITSGEQLLAQEPTAEHYYRQALRYQRISEDAKAIAALEEAASRAPEERLYAVSLAYAYRQADRNAQAIPLFAYGLLDEEYASARGDYAYALKNEGQREESARQFRLKLDEKLPEEKRYALRREVQQLEDNWITVGSVTYRDGVARASGAPGIQSFEDSLQYGLETVYSRDDWQRDGRRVQFYGQLFSSSDTGGFNLNADSTQGAVGVRATPLANTEWYVYAARLFAVGEDALDDWQLRTTYAYTKGFDYDPTRQSWEYLFLTPDISYLVDKEELFATAEARYGRSYRLNEGSHWVMTPHVVTAAAHQHSPQQSRDALELGVGLSAKYWFDESEKRAPRGSAELILQWREPIAGSEDKGGPFLRFVLQY